MINNTDELANSALPFQNVITEAYIDELMWLTQIYAYISDGETRN